VAFIEASGNGLPPVANRRQIAAAERTAPTPDQRSCSNVFSNKRFSVRVPMPKACRASFAELADCVPTRLMSYRVSY
jgi:hypothetical protein